MDDVCRAAARAQRCTALLSATLHAGLGSLADELMKNPAAVGFSLKQVCVCTCWWVCGDPGSLAHEVMRDPAATGFSRVHSLERRRTTGNENGLLFTLISVTLVPRLSFLPYSYRCRRRKDY